MKHSPPPAENQINFLQNIQQLFEEGEFTATYKFALLMALTELAVENWDRTVPELRLSMKQIAEKFIEFYWPQCVIYSSGVSGTNDGILVQNLGMQASIVNAVLELRSHTASITAAKNLPEWHSALSGVAGVIRNQPVRYLQNISSTLNPFLYDFPAPHGELVLKADVAFNLARYQRLIQQLAKSAWVSHVRTNARNEPYIGKKDDLESFMFGASRSTLAKAGEVLIELGEDKCFYCEKPLQQGFDVDHFIPWSKYPRDLAHNFVLAHQKCNRSKSDMLAAHVHLEKWIHRNKHDGDQIQIKMNSKGIIANLGCIESVAKYVYEQGIEVQAHAWIRKENYEKIEPKYIEALT